MSVGEHRVASSQAMPLPAAALLVALLWAVAGTAAAASAEPCAASNVSSIPTQRFTDNGDGTVTDMNSKLMWMRCSMGQRWQSGNCAGAAGVLSLAESKLHAEQVNLDGDDFYNDWRVPSLRELATITERECFETRTEPRIGLRMQPRTDSAVFPGTAPAAYWSATPRPGEAAGTRFLAMGFGAEGVFAARQDERHHVRLVRTGP